ncbi:MAG: trehalose-phosphatase, partial [Chloroflexota bacterium]
ARRAPDLAVVSGRAGFDFVPRVAWDKGRAALWIARRVARAVGPPPPLIVYAGDDATDERVFAALKGRGVTVRVGGGASLADHAVHGVREVHALLRWIGRAIG